MAERWKLLNKKAFLNKNEVNEKKNIEYVFWDRPMSQWEMYDAIMKLNDTSLFNRQELNKDNDIMPF